MYKPKSIKNKEKPLSVTELNLKAKVLLEHTMGSIVVEGEISNFVQPKSGHWYFSLKDKNSQIRTVMFKSSNLSVKFKPENGTLVIVKGSITLYTERGDFQLVASSMSIFGEGILQQKYEELVKKLSKEGLFDEKWKKPLPFLPKKIGLITSPTGAALHDILNILKRRFPAIPIIIYPTQVQGQTAYKKIVNAINTANKHNVCDVLILSRGGGTLEDLWPFNEEEVARAIFKCHIPIITGIGHEIDFTISDFVADKRASTPSAAAELATPDQNTVLMNINNLKKNMFNIIQQYISNLFEKVHWYKKRLRDPKNQIQNGQLKLENLIKNLNKNIKRILEIKRTNFAFTVKKLHTVSPLATLDRGYSIVTSLKTNNIIKTSANLTSKDKIEIVFSKGSAICSVDEVN